MIDPAFVRMMARYNAWQNENLAVAADGLGEAARRLDRGAFFQSIHGTFCHILWADEVWLSRLIGTPKPAMGGRDSPRLVEDWDAFRTRRTACDRTILDWAAGVGDDWLAGTLVWYSGAAGRELAKPRAITIAHLFNHQTHHRGQIHAMLTAAGARPGDTDLFLLDDAG